MWHFPGYLINNGLWFVLCFTCISWLTRGNFNCRQLVTSRWLYPNRVWRHLIAMTWWVREASGSVLEIHVFVVSVMFSPRWGDFRIERPDHAPENPDAAQHGVPVLVAEHDACGECGRPAQFLHLHTVCYNPVRTDCFSVRSSDIMSWSWRPGFPVGKLPLGLLPWVRSQKLVPILIWP